MGQKHRPHSIIFTERSKTKLAFQAECDINKIMARYAETGLVAHVAKNQGHYGDVSTEVEYQEALGIIQAAGDTFASLPAKIRSRFHNNPGAFLEFVEKPENRDEMREMGLLPPKQPPLTPGEPLKQSTGVEGPSEGENIEPTPTAPQTP